MTPKLLAETLMYLFQKGLTYDDTIRGAVREITAYTEAIEKDIQARNQRLAGVNENPNNRPSDNEVFNDKRLNRSELLGMAERIFDDPQKISEE